MEKTIVFDMDGTIANFYGYNDWLEHIKMESEEPYIHARPMVDMKEFNDLGKRLINKGYSFKICSWLADNSTQSYDRKVRKAKKDWLKKYINFDLEKIHLVKYGSNKRYRAKGQYLFDDNQEVIKMWEGQKQDRIGILCNKENAEYNNEIILTNLRNMLR